MTVINIGQATDALRPDRVVTHLVSEDAPVVPRGTNFVGGLTLGQRDLNGNPLLPALNLKLKDKRPAIRSRGAQTLADLDYEPSLHALALLLADKSENSYGEGGLKQYTSRQHRVDDAALTAIHDLTQDKQNLRFTYSIRDKKDYDPALQAEVTREASRAANWYLKNKNSLPPAR